MIEKEMEDLIAQHPEEFFDRKILVLRGRQQTFAGVGRFDLLFEDQFGSQILMELKARPAKYEDATQLAKYKEEFDRRGMKNVIMWLVATLISTTIRGFLDHIGIEYSEIHEAEFRRVAAKHKYSFASEVNTDPPGEVDPPNSNGRTTRERIMKILQDRQWYTSADLRRRLNLRGINGVLKRMGREGLIERKKTDRGF